MVRIDENMYKGTINRVTEHKEGNIKVMIIIIIYNNCSGDLILEPRSLAQSPNFSALTLINTAVNVYSDKYLNIKIKYIQARINLKTVYCLKLHAQVSLILK